MVIGHIKDLDGVKVDNPAAKNIMKKVPISPEHGWEGYVMRVFELGEDGYSPKHIHEWPHINYFISGKGYLHLDGTDHEVEGGSFSFVPPNKIHQFRNRGEEPFVFICIVPEEGDK